MGKKVVFMAPIDYATGNMSGHQTLQYGSGGSAYEQITGARTEANNYEARLIAKRLKAGTRYARSYFQVRTKSTVNMTNAVRMNMAVMGGAGALFASLLRQKTSLIYIQCDAAKPKELTLRQFLFPLIMAALSNKSEIIEVTSGVEIVNPWISAETPNVPVSQTILDKFNILNS